MGSITFDDIRPLFKLRIDEAPVVDFLKRFPEHRITKPSDGSQYAIFKPLGFDLLFQPLAGPQGGPSKKLRVMKVAFLYRNGKDKHQEFREPPFGIKFSDTRDVLVQKLGEPFTSSLMVKVTPPLPLCWEKWWVGDDLALHASYDMSNMTTQVFAIGPE